MRNAALAAKAFTGRSQADLAHAMAAAVANAEFATAADALVHLRHAFPQVSRNVRVAAASLLMERQQRAFKSY